MCPRRESYGSATSWILDRIGYSFAVRRNTLYPPELEEAEDEKERRRILGTIRYVIQVLRNKDMVFLIPKRFVINVPLTLTYYNVKGGSIPMVAEVLRSGGKLSADEARVTAERVINSYYSRFEPFIDDLLEFYQAYRKILIALNEYEVRYSLERRFYEYLPFILIESRERGGVEESDKRVKKRLGRIKQRTLEFLKTVVKIVEQDIGSRAIESLYYRWRMLEDRINELAYDNDPHVESIAGRFLDRVVRYAINILLPAHDESRRLRILHEQESGQATP